MPDEKSPNHRKALEDTQRFRYVPDLENRWADAAKAFCSAYTKHTLAQIDARVEGKKTEMTARGERFDDHPAARHEVIKRRFDLVCRQIIESIGIVTKVRDPKEPGGVALSLQISLETLLENDPKMRNYYLRIDLPQDYSRDEFIKTFNHKLAEFGCGISDKNAIKKFADKTVEGVYLRTCLIPLSEVLFPKLERDR